MTTLSYKFDQVSMKTSHICQELKYASQALYAQTVGCFRNLLNLYTRSSKISNKKFRKIVSSLGSEIKKLDTQIKKAFPGAPIVSYAPQCEDFLLDLSGGIQLELDLGI